LYAIAAGIATISPATVVTSASATPGATAAMLPEPSRATPMNECITPITVPSSPRSGATVAMMASQRSPPESSSRSSPSSFSSTSRSTSSCAGLRPRTSLPCAHRPGAQLGEEGHAALEDAGEGRLAQREDRLVRVLQPLGRLDAVQEDVGLAVGAAELEELPDDEHPRDEGEHRQDSR
jgi:hypothetical protein